VTPEEALSRILHCLDRALESGFKTKAFVGALDVVRRTDDAELRRLAAAHQLTRLDGIGPSTAAVIEQALAGEVPRYLADLEASTQITISDAARVYLDALRGDCHLHTRWSDGGATVEAMALAARELGHEYLVITDHSPRLTIAHGLDRERLLRQFDEIDEVRDRVDGIRLLTGMEVDILEDGSLDLDDDLLERLDLVVASVHSKLKMAAFDMTRRMLAAVRSPHVDVLGHCTGRLIDKRAPSSFDAARVFAACAEHRTAVEINCRPERLDPPAPLVTMAIDAGCWFTIDSDAHATGQLEWQPYGCERAAECDVPVERIVNTFDADRLLAWTAS
jgi:putative hydrolase